MKMYKAFIPAMAVGLFVSGCSSEPTPSDPQKDYETLTDNNHTKFIYEGDSVVLHPETNSIAVTSLKKQFPLLQRTPLLFEHGLEDISQKAQRYTPRVALSGDSPKLKNDIACDSLRIKQVDWQGKPYIAALAVGNSSDDEATVNWPQGSDYIHVCVPKGHNPSDGVILMAPQVAR